MIDVPRAHLNCDRSFRPWAIGAWRPCGGKEIRASSELMRRSIFDDLIDSNQKAFRST
jgi:hypothetical protein